MVCLEAQLKKDFKIVKSPPSFAPSRNTVPTLVLNKHLPVTKLVLLTGRPILLRRLDEPDELSDSAAELLQHLQIPL